MCLSACLPVCTSVCVCVCACVRACLTLTDGAALSGRSVLPRATQFTTLGVVTIGHSPFASAETATVQLEELALLALHPSKQTHGLGVYHETTGGGGGGGGGYNPNIM